MKYLKYFGLTSRNSLISIFGFIQIFFYFIPVIGILNFCFINRRNLLLVLKAVGFVLSNIENLSRWYTLLHSPDIFKLYQGIQELYDDCTVNEKNKLNKANASLRKIIRTLSIINFGAAYGLLGYPLVRGLLDIFVFKTKNSLDLEYPYCSQLPFVDDLPEIVFYSYYLIMVLQATFFTLNQIGAIGWMAVISINLSENLVILQNQFKNTQFVGFSDIREAILKHKRIISLSINLNETFRLCIFFQSFCGSLHLGTIAYQIVEAPDLLAILNFIPYCLSISFDLFILCYCGQVINFEVSFENILYLKQK